MPNPADNRFEPTSRTRLKRIPDRGSYDRETIYRILDEGLVCHVGFVDQGDPFVIPTIYVRIDYRVYLHGSPGSRMLRHVAEAGVVCVTVTLLDGLVLARSAFHHSINYRSVVVLGSGQTVGDREEKRGVLHRLTEKVVPGRWDEVRQPSASELDGTAVVAVELTEASAKVRSGPPKDDEVDYHLPVWAGELRLRLRPEALIADPRLPPETAVPAYLSHWNSGQAGRATTD